jgi:D-xylose transport system substrate-binding protein
MRNLKKGTAALLALTVASAGVMATVGAVAAQDDEVVVGVSWANFQEPRWALWDKTAIQATLDAAGAQYIEADAQTSSEKQVSDIENLIAQGADALIIIAWEGKALGPAIDSALAEGIPVVGYDRLIEDDRVFYTSFDNVEVGRMQARGVQAVQPTGNYVFIKGSPTDANADFLYGGQLEVLDEAIQSGDIVNVADVYTDGWLDTNAQANMEQILTERNDDVQAVVASNDGTARGVMAALASRGLLGTVPVSGQDGDFPNLNAVALGNQTVDVWKDARMLGEASTMAALELIENGGDLSAVSNAAPFETPEGNTVWSVLLEPIPITQDNLDLVVDAGWISTEELCQNVEAGSVAACP